MVASANETAVYLLALLMIVVVLLPAGLGNLEVDREALLHLMEKADLERVMVSNWTGSDPCAARWEGVGCNMVSGAIRVTVVRVEKKGLTGVLPLASVGQLTELRVFSVRDNALKGRLPSDLYKCSQLKKLYLNANLFEGPIPESLSILHRLDRLVLANNRLTGTIPNSLAKLKKLATLRLEFNLLTGRVPDLSGLLQLKDFNVSWNRLSGRVPSGMANRELASFTGNNLCGQPVSANCTDDGRGRGKHRHHTLAFKQLVAIVIISACIALVSIILGIFLCYKCRRSLIGGGRSESHAQQQQPVPPKPPADLMFVRREDTNLFDLDELLHAPAELLGKGSLGSTYKAVFAGGLVVAVKRLVDTTECTRKVFERRIKVVGRLTHPYLVPLIAYHFYATQEKLLVYNFMPRGSLHSLLHASSSSGNNSLTWSMRLEIAQGVAKCLRFLHHQCKLVHGNIKSSNILLTEKYEARVSDFGLLPFTPADAKANSYRAPEFSSSIAGLNRKADVYSYGILLLELLTGKLPHADATTRRRNDDDLPSWVIAAANEQVLSSEQDMEQEVALGLFKIALSCISLQPESRPDMHQVMDLIEEMTGSADYSFIHSYY